MQWIALWDHNLVFFPSKLKVVSVWMLNNQWIWSLEASRSKRRDRRRCYV